ncbi:hypothetical protein [Corynebacterium crudilactis]|uniref:Uncharacterized protein n=1 Tax=Corynebacterium crudilactis TaxID=1652495 RepID=A0A172QXL5_9CORY|nr:hypothetical protein [Corynebacterium crudilactis]ANE05453.1 hypothetical protein ccrud_14020 [Corynebacterium crudilactis]
MNVETLIKAGTHQWCPRCKNAIILTASECCASCKNTPTNISVPKPASTVAAPTASGKRFLTPNPTSQTFIRPEALGELSRFEDCSLWIVAAGKPETQGSMKAVGGVVKHSNGKKLHAWRDTLTKEALRTVAGKWTALNIPVCLDVVLTVPAPAKLPPWNPLETEDSTPPRVPPMVPPDVDKLLRAVQDALSPRDNKKPGEIEKLRDRRFKLLVDDSRIIDSSARKTYPRPRHTHDWALDYPGAVLRISPVGHGVPALPASTLLEPAQLPPQVAELAKQLETRASHQLI